MSSEETDRSIEKKGIVDGADRIAGELLRNPRFKKSLIILLSSIDPESARGLVRTLFWEDSDVTLSVIGAAPDIVNTCIEALAEVAGQVETMPAPLLGEVLARLLSEVDAFTLGEAVGTLAGLGPTLAGDSAPADGLDRLRREFARGYLAGAGDGGGDLASRLGSWMERTAAAAGDENSSTRAVMRAIGTALEENPGFVERVVKPIIAAVAGTGAAGEE